MTTIPKSVSIIFFINLIVFNCIVGLVSIVAIICFSILIFLCTCMIFISFILRRIKNDNENQPKESCERSCVEPSFTGQSISVSRTRRSYIPRRYSSGQRSKRSVQKSDYSRTRSQLHTPSRRRCSDISVTDSRNEPNQNRMSYSNN